MSRSKLIGAALLAPFTWAAYIAVTIPLYILGWIMVPLAAACKAYVSIYDAEKAAKGEDPIVYHFTWPIMRPYFNFEDGVANTTYKGTTWPLWARIVYWSCIRNPINGLRTVPILSFKLKPGNVQAVQRGASYFAYQGPYSCIYLSNGKYEFWCGWKLRPAYVNPAAPIPHYLSRGVGFALQLRRV